MAQTFGAPNFLSVIDAYEAGSQRRERNRLAELDTLGRELQGKALGGDQNALAQLGQVNPQAYMQTKQFTTEQKQTFLKDFARSAYDADTPEKYAAVVNRFRQQGHQFDPGEDAFENRQSMINQVIDIGDRMGMDLRREESKRAQANADRNYQLARDRMNAPPDAPSGYRYAANGSLEFIPGGPADPSKPVPTRNMRPTGDQSNAAGFYDRMAASNKTISALEQQGTDYWQNFARNYAPGGTSAYFMTPEFQQYDQAQRDFINAQLRKESGAAIGESEFENARRQYFPQPGDSPQVIKQKAQNRQIAIDAMHRTAGPALQMGQQQAVPQQSGELQPGAVEDGYVFLGGDPSDPESWQEAR